MRPYNGRCNRGTREEIDVDEANEKLGEQLKVIAEPMRFKILQLLLDKHHCSRSLALTLGITESAVSQHMTVLKKTGLVKGFRHGRHVHYVVDTQALEQAIAVMQSWIGRASSVGDCHIDNTCEFKLDDGSNGCLYSSTSDELS